MNITEANDRNTSISVIIWMIRQINFIRDEQSARMETNVLYTNPLEIERLQCLCDLIECEIERINSIDNHCNMFLEYADEFVNSERMLIELDRWALELREDLPNWGGELFEE